MSESPILNRKLHCLLIGVDCYMPNRLPDGGCYQSLAGCVRDIGRVETFLKKLGVPDAQITKLTATDTGAETPSEPEDRWPTYENIVAAFQRLIRDAREGEQVYVHYSGHGGRTVTGFPELKGADGLDESLVPTDIGRAGTRYLRDVEMAYLLQQMVEKKLVATIVFDSCHSGGATRGLGGATARGIPSIDTTERPAESLVATREELARVWRAVPPGRTRNAELGARWVPEMDSVLLLAACRANEVANETEFAEGERNGALTYWLLDSLKQVGSGLTFKMLHDRILGKVRAQFPSQTPQLHGDGARVVFDVNRAPRPASVRVLEVDRARYRLKLEAGKAQGVGAGSNFAVYAAQAADFTNAAERLALASVTSVEATTSWAELADGGDLSSVEEGAQAILLDAGALKLRGRIRLVKQDGLPASFSQEAALQKAAAEIEGSNWVRAAKDGEGADYQVAVNANGEYEVWDATGQLISNLRPALKVEDADAAAGLVKRLVHLTKYRNVKLIDNSDAHATLARQLTVELEGAEAPGGEYVLEVGESATLRVTNNSPKVLNLTIFDLQPDWGVKKVYPSDADSEILDPGRSLELPLTDVSLPEGYAEGVDAVKVFATVEPTSFNWLELPALDQPNVRSLKRSPSNPLEQLMAGFAADAPPPNLRAFNLNAPAAATWTAAQLEFRVRRPVQAPRHVREPALSLLQAAIEETSAAGVRRARAAGGAPATRAGVGDTDIEAVTDYWLDPPPAGQRSVIDTAKYCAGVLARMGKEFWNAWHGDRAEYEALKAALTARFTDCDLRFVEALARYLEFLESKGEVPYRRWQNLSDFVVEGKLPADASVGVVADWGTGQPEAVEVLRQVKRHDPRVVVHLGDVYYAGTAYEMENYFYLPWRQVLQPETSGVASFALPGNHDLYSGGRPFYDLLDKFGQPASYFCLRNEHWQLIGLDTALHDRLGGPPTSLEPSELDWLRDKVENSGGRRTILLSHHQLFSTNEKFGGKSYNENLYGQVAPLLPRVDLWLWGHEHDLVVFGDHMGLRRGRCVGGSAFPVGKYEQPAVPQNPDVPFNRQVALGKGSAFYQHCYAVVRLDGPRATASYYEDSEGGRLLFEEELE
ncbi:MAG: caspase family protein [Acidobacteria bacterium]|nr:caspase family protein [Acidobacteriota bacterium]